MMDDDLDDSLRREARSYREPPDVPREAMWQAIERAREVQRVMPIAGHGRARRWVAAVTGIAAILMIGFALGRVSHAPVLPEAKVASMPPASPASPDSAESTAPAAVRPTSRDDRTRSPSRVVASNADRRSSSRSVPGDRSVTASEPGGDVASYRLAVVEHLARTEMMLAGFRSQVRSNTDGRIDVQFAALSRDLLATTRLLLATRHADDPAMTRLLQDLELVLMQLSQYATDGRRGDLDAVERSLEKHNVMPKLRSTISAGFSTTSGT